MLKFIFRRLLEAIPTLFILITISFFMMRLAPGSPFTGERALPPEVLANIEAKYHLNDPIWKQYGHYLVQLGHGDFGPSFKYKDYSVNDLVSASFPVSAKLGFAAFLLAVVFGVTAGVLALLIHLSALESCGRPYLAPFSSARLGGALLRRRLVQDKFRDRTLRPQDLRNQK